MKNQYIMTISIVAMLIFMSSVAMAAVWTDRLDYSPGSMVTISGDNSDGAGYLAGETVNVSVNGPGSYDSRCSAVASSSGTWSCQITLASDLSAEGSYTYTAVGQTSGVSQSGTFTDAPSSMSYSPTTTQNLAANAGGASVSFSQSVTATKNNGVFTATLQVAGTGTSIPVSWVSTSPTPLSFVTTSSTGDTKSWAVTFTVPSGTAAGTYTANIKANPSISGVGAGPGTPVSLTVSADSTPPVITHSVTPNPSITGWYNIVTGSPTITFSVNDPESGISSKSGCDAQTINTDTSGIILTCTATNGAGLQSSDQVTSKIDKTLPTISGVATTQPNENGWYNSNVIIHFTVNDQLSGIDTVPADQAINSEGTDKSVTGTVTDKAGNIASIIVDNINIDKTAPDVEVTHSPDANSNGWNNGPVIVSFIATDSLSGIDGDSSISKTLSSEGANQGASQEFKDKAGNSATGGITGINIDLTLPTLTFGIATPEANSAGWNKDDVSIPFTVEDSMSGVGSTSSSNLLVLTAEGSAITGSVTVTDKAGNSASFTSSAFKIDKTSPSVEGAADRIPDNNGWYNHAVGATFTGIDSGSGIDPTSCTSSTYNGPDSASASVSGNCKDIAGNIGTGSLSIKYDATPPAITGSRSPSANTYDWNNEDVTIHFDCSDTLSGIDGCTDNKVMSDEGSGQSVTGTATDKAGNTVSATVGDINIDKTKPTISGSPSPGPNSNGWNNGDVTVSYACADSLSAVVSCTGPQTLSTDGAGQTSAGTVIDKAGNTASVTVDNINIDKTAPNVVVSRTPGPNSNGWNNGPVTVSFIATDTGSGIDGQSTTTTTLSSEGANQGASHEFKDKAGNSATGGITGINIDTTPPNIDGDPTTSPNINGWYKSDVTVHIDASDSLSGIDTVTPDILMSTEGTGQSVTGTATDKAGNSNSYTESGINIDKTKPLMTINTPKAVDYLLNQNVLADWSATDGLSGLSSSSGTVASGNPIDTGSVGTKTFVVIAEDKAGNINDIPISYNIKYASSGICNGDQGHQILQPINNDGSSNFRKGSTVPAKLRGCDANGNSIGTPGVVKDFKLTGQGADSGSLNEVVDSTTPDTVYRWDPNGKLWIFNIGTKSLSANVKYFYTITLNDGSTIKFNFGLR